MSAERASFISVEYGGQLHRMYRKTAERIIQSQEEGHRYSMTRFGIAPLKAFDSRWDAIIDSVYDVFSDDRTLNKEKQWPTINPEAFDHTHIMSEAERSRMVFIQQLRDKLVEAPQSAPVIEQPPVMKQRVESAGSQAPSAVHKLPDLHHQQELVQKRLAEFRQGQEDIWQACLNGGIISFTPQIENGGKYSFVLVEYRKGLERKSLTISAEFYLNLPMHESHSPDSHTHRKPVSYLRAVPR